MVGLAFSWLLLYSMCVSHGYRLDIPTGTWPADFRGRAWLSEIAVFAF